MASSVIRYRSCRPPETELRGRLRDLANERRRFGYRRLCAGSHFPFGTPRSTIAGFAFRVDRYRSSLLLDWDYQSPSRMLLASGLHLTYESPTGPSPKLASAITQVLDQVNHLQSDTFRLKALDPEHQMESFGIRGVLVAGVLPDPARKWSFELFRNALVGLSIITFDELRAKLGSLRVLLAAEDGGTRAHS